MWNAARGHSQVLNLCLPSVVTPPVDPLAQTPFQMLGFYFVKSVCRTTFLMLPRVWVCVWFFVLRGKTSKNNVRWRGKHITTRERRRRVCVYSWTGLNRYRNVPRGDCSCVGPLCGQMSDDWNMMVRKICGKCWLEDKSQCWSNF